jgi:putative ABC transport system permease protein
VNPLYRVLLHLYPASFRMEYGEEMSAVFAEQRARARGCAAVGLLLTAVADVVPNALALHWAVLVQDLRYTARTLSRSRGFALTTVLVTALGVGANTAAVSVADFVLLRPLPFPEPDNLVRLCEGPRSGGGWGCMNELSPANYRDARDLTTSFEGLGAFVGASVNLVGAGEPQRISAVSVTAEVLPLLGVPPLLGRVFDTATASPHAQTVVLGYGFWQSQLDGAPDVIGRTVRLDGTPHEVIGVMPRGFYFPTRDVELWMPLALREAAFLNRNNTYLQAVGRLKHGVTFDQSRADLAVVFEGLARDYAESNAETGFSFFRQRDYVFPRFRLMLLALCGASLCMLLLTCANLANLLLARAAARERELAVRAALGAGRERLVRQLLTESVILALIGGAVGVLVAVLAVPLLASLVPITLPIAGRPSVDLRMLGIAAAFAALTGLGFGLIPALRVGGHAGCHALREGTRSGGGRKQRLRAILVSIEVAVSVVLLVSSGLLIRAVWRVQEVDPGFVPEDALTATTALPSPRYDRPAPRDEFYRRVLSDVRALPGVRSAAYTSGLPMVLTGGIGGVVIAGREVVPGRREGASTRWVTPQFFDAMGIPVKAGRDIEQTDVADRRRVAVVSESFVERYWPGEDGLGRTFETRGAARTIVGVVGDVRVRGLERTSEPQVYLPAAQSPDTMGALYIPKVLVIRFSGNGSGLLPAVHRIVRAADPEQPVSNVRTLADVVAGETATRRAQLRVLGALALIALLLAGVGIHGLLAFTVAQRSQEIGVRLALGAEPARVARMILTEGTRLTLVGLVPGLAGAYAAARGMRALLFAVDPADPATIGAGVGLALVMTLAGCVVPALRAVRVSPVVAMRAE